MMNNMATIKNDTGKRSGGSFEGTIPHSYGADFAVLGLRGASNNEATELSPPKIMASTIKTMIGRYCPIAFAYAFAGSCLALRLARSIKSRRWSNQHRIKKIMPEPNVMKMAGWRLAPKSRIMCT